MHLFSALAIAITSLLFSTVASASASASTIASASTVASATMMDDFLLTGGDYTASWVLAARPLGAAGLGGTTLQLEDVSFAENGTAQRAAVMNFYAKSEYGGFDFEDASGALVDELSFTGAQLFQGSWSTATFRLGSFHLTQDGCGNSGGGGDNWNCGATLVISQAATAPEPGSLLLLATGGAGVLTGVQRRRRG